MEISTPWARERVTLLTQGMKVFWREPPRTLTLLVESIQGVDNKSRYRFQSSWFPLHCPSHFSNRKMGTVSYPYMQIGYKEKCHGTGRQGGLHHPYKDGTIH